MKTLVSTLKSASKVQSKESEIKPIQKFSSKEIGQKKKNARGVHCAGGGGW